MRIRKALFGLLLVAACMAVAPAAFALPSDESESFVNLPVSAAGNAESAGTEGADAAGVAQCNTQNAQSPSVQGDAVLAGGQTGFAVTLDLSGIDGVGTTVYVDGNPVEATVSGATAAFALSTTDAKTAVMYVFAGAGSADPHEIYPTGMYVWFLSCDGQGAYTATRASDFDNILRYAGCAIRLVGEKGIRMVTGIPESARNALMGSGLEGYTLLEYGTVVGYAKDYDSTETVVLDQASKSGVASKSGKAYCAAEGKDNIYAVSNGLVQYTNVLTNFTNEQCKEDLLMRSYMKVRDASGDEITIYGGTVQRSIGYIAYQNRNSSVLTRGSNARDFVWDIVWSVYGNEYVGDYFGMEPVTDIATGTYALASKLDMSKVAYVPDSENGTSLQLYSWRSDLNYQQFTITNNGDGTYGVSVVGSGKALAVSSTSHSADVIQAEPDLASELQKWWIFRDEDHCVLASVAGHTVIDLTNSATGSGTNIQAVTYRASDNQCWELFDPTQAGVRVARSARLNEIVAGIVADRDLPECFSYIVSTYKWAERSIYPTWEYWPEDYALEIAETGSSNCYAYASLFFFCAQALGYYDMMVISGEISWRDTMVPHGWCEMNGCIYDPEITYSRGLTIYGVPFDEAAYAYRHIG